MADRLRRRDVLAIASAAAVAGCSGTSDDPENESGPANDSEPTDTTTDDVDNETEDVQDDLENETDSDDELGDDNESDGDQQSDDEEQADQEDGEEDEPTNEELVKEAIDDAQRSLEDAVGELTAQIGPNTDVTEFTVAVDLSTGPVEDHLSQTRQAIDEAEQYQVRPELTVTIDALANAELLLRTIVERQPALHDAYLDVDSLREDLVAENFEAVLDSADRTLRSIEDVQRDGKQLQSTFEDTSTGDFDRVNALSEDAITTIFDGFESDLTAMETFVTAARSFSDPYPAYVGSGGSGQDESVDEVQDRYEEIAATLEDVSSVALNDVLEKFYCTVSALAEAANDYRVSGQAAEVGDMIESNQREDEAEEHLKDAQNCGMFDINIPE
jgi:ribosomal protein L12E/L44/L45/RPP1/RPP2